MVGEGDSSEALRLQEHKYEVHHILGKDNEVTDAASRCLSCLHSVVVPVIPQVWLMLEALSEDKIKEIKKFHRELLGHRGVHATKRLMREAGHDGKGLRSAIEWYVRNCRDVPETQLGQGAMAVSLAMVKVLEPGKEWSIDTIGPLPGGIDWYKHSTVAAVTQWAAFQHSSRQIQFSEWLQKMQHKSF